MFSISNLLSRFSQSNLNVDVAAGMSTEATSQTLNQIKDAKKIALTHWRRQWQHGTKPLSQLPYAFYVVAKGCAGEGACACCNDRACHGAE